MSPPTDQVCLLVNLALPQVGRGGHVDILEGGSRMPARTRTARSRPTSAVTDGAERRAVDRAPRPEAARQEWKGRRPETTESPCRALRDEHRPSKSPLPSPG